MVKGGSYFLVACVTKTSTRNEKFHIDFVPCNCGSKHHPKNVGRLTSVIEQSVYFNNQGCEVLTHSHIDWTKPIDFVKACMDVTRRATPRTA